MRWAFFTVISISFLACSHVSGGDSDEVVDGRSVREWIKVLRSRTPDIDL
jgi:hypothetical protein